MWTSRGRCCCKSSLNRAWHWETGCWDVGTDVLYCCQIVALKGAVLEFKQSMNRNKDNLHTSCCSHYLKWDWFRAQRSRMCTAGWGRQGLAHSSGRWILPKPKAFLTLEVNIKSYKFWVVQDIVLSFLHAVYHLRSNFNTFVLSDAICLLKEARFSSDIGVVVSMLWELNKRAQLLLQVCNFAVLSQWLICTKAVFLMVTS